MVLTNVPHAPGYHPSNTKIFLARLRLCAALRELECARHCACLRVRLRNEPQEGTVDGLKNQKRFGIITIALPRPRKHRQIQLRTNLDRLTGEILHQFERSSLSAIPHLILKNEVVAFGCMGCVIMIKQYDLDVACGTLPGNINLRYVIIPPWPPCFNVERVSRTI